MGGRERRAEPSVVNKRSQTPVLRISRRPLVMLSVVAGLFVNTAAIPRFGFDVWTADDGLPQNIIRGLHQTPEGYIWIATFDGIARFDGVQFKVFDKISATGIQSARFSSLSGGRNGDLWLSTDGGGVTRYHEGHFSSYTTQHGLPQNSVRAVAADQDGNVWALSADLILKWNEASQRFVDVTPRDRKLRFDVLLWETGGFWGADEQQLHCFVNGKIDSYRLPAWLPGSSIRFVARDRTRTIWLETQAGLVATVDPAKGFTKVSGSDLSVSYRDRHGRQWDFGVDKGLVRYLQQSLPGRSEKISFSRLKEDREGNLWLGTEGQGLYKLRPQFIRAYSTAQGLPNRNVYLLLQDRSGAIWAGGWRGGLSRFQDGKFTNYSVQDGLADAVTTALAEDSHGRLWIAANENLRVFVNGRFQKPVNPVLPPNVRIQAMIEDREGAFWFGTSRGLLRYQGGKVDLMTDKDGLAAEDVKVLVESADGALWIGGFGGLTRLQHGKFTRWTERDGLPSSSIRSIYEDREGVLWIGAYDSGLGRLQNGKFTRYTTRVGLFNNGAFRILEDGRGNLWMSSNRGVYRVSKTELNEFAAGVRTAIASVAYGRADGMLNVECNGGYWPSGVHARDGTLWFPTQDGIVVIDPNAVRANLQAPPVMIESFLVDRESLSLDQPLRIEPGKETFEIQYTALSFINSDQIRFRYRLDGLDSGWTEAGGRRTAYFSHLPPGKYVFSVIAGNSDGIWNEMGQSLQIIVLAPFYKTLWFQAIVGLVSMAAVAAAWRYRESQFRRLEAVQQAFSRQLIASQENERKRIAAELHDSLGQRLVVIKNLALFFLRDHEASAVMNGRLKGIEEISSEAALAINETREISYDLRPFQLDRLGLTKAVEGLLRTVSKASDLRCSTEMDNVDDLFPEDLRINFYRIVQECTNNIVKHAEASEVHVSVKRSGRGVALTIRDNGRGFRPGAGKGDLGRGGFGQIGMAERASLLGGRLDIQSAPDRGTVVTVLFDTGRHNG